MKILKEKTSGLGGQFSPAYPVCSHYEKVLLGTLPITTLKVY